LQWFAVTLLIAGTVAYGASLITAGRGEFQGQMVVDSMSILPDLVRLRQGDHLNIYNANSDERTLVLEGRSEPLIIPPRESVTFAVKDVEIIRVFQRDVSPSRSSFIIVDRAGRQ
jgi:hypothetical protein